MTEEEVKSDPEFQLKAIEKAYEQSSQQLNQLESVLQKFSTNFQSQEHSLTELYQKISKQQGIHRNIVKVRDCINEIQNKLTSTEQLSPILKTNIESNFDAYMEAMNKAIAAKKFLNRFQFNDAYNERMAITKLIEAAQRTILIYFIKLAHRSATPVLLSNFAFKDGKFVLTEKLYENPIYPVAEELLRMMKRMAEVLDITLCEDQYKEYQNARIDAINESISPILDASKKRVLQAQTLDIIDLPNYKPKEHPIHTIGYLVSFFYKRELAFAKAIFGEKYKNPFVNSFTPLFNTFKSICHSVMFANVQSPIDILFDVDLVSTIVDVLESEVNEDEFSMFAVQLAQMSHMFHSGIERVLSAYKSAVEHHDPDNIPASGGVTANVSNVIIFLKKLSIYKKGIEQVGGLSFDQFAPAVLAAMFKNNMEKATRYNDDILKQLFLMNNAHYALMQIEASPELATITPQEFKDTLEKTMQDAQKVYMNETWNAAFQILSYDKAFDGFKKGDKLNTQQKKIIKNKFKKFKEAVLDIQQKHNTYCLKNTKLMEPIMNEAIQKTHSKFEPCYMRWHDSGFASHPEKYTAVQPSTLEGIITRLYGAKKIRKTSV